MLDHKKMHFIFRESFEDDIGKLWSFLNKGPVKKLVFLMIGCKKKPVSIGQVLRARYAYCAYRLVVEELGKDFALKWLSRSSFYLDRQTPLSVIRNCKLGELPIIIKAAIAVIQASNGVLP